MGVVDAYSWVASLSWRGKVLVVATIVVGVELAFRRFAPKSLAYSRWTKLFEGIGTFWTAILLSIVYVVSVGPVSLISRLRGHDPLDRALRPEPSFWRPHEPNPLGPEAAVRHQF